MGGQIEQGFAAFGLAIFREYWDKGLRECTLGKQSTQKIRDLEGNQKDVGCGSGAKDNCQYLVTHEAQDT